MLDWDRAGGPRSGAKQGRRKGDGGGERYDRPLEKGEQPSGGCDCECDTAGGRD